MYWRLESPHTSTKWVESTASSIGQRGAGGVVALAEVPVSYYWHSTHREREERRERGLSADRLLGAVLWRGGVTG